MVFELFRTSRLAENEMSSPIEFVVLLGAEQTFLRTIAHLEANVVHGGAPPTFLIKAGLGGPTAVEEGADPVDITGSGGTTVATADCHRIAEDIDTYLVTVNHSASSGPWQLQIKNNEPEALDFVGFISHTEDETLQSWANFSQPQLEGQETETTHGIGVHNVGTAPLIIEDAVGSHLGGSGSPCIITARPDPIAPHEARSIAVKCKPLEGQRRERSEDFVHTFSTNDPHLAHSRIGFTVAWPTFPTMCLPDEGCSVGCKEFVPRMPPDEFQCETCFDDAGFHGLPSNPDRTPR
ncbi:hypothetical protein OHA98_19220 [Streptomyces sp. NBC_00654]|uniref:hypothetical protein n=1 Tax=Streptomyces sp. NBC_00654 TaxID=2975799 RepID=UPI00224F8241|nr:hypothetical protein [Streptomyces sp. NBC_00654]MCX4966922.1 hypothetical protein [Streptomyces sp. NBC_00654]